MTHCIGEIMALPASATQIMIIDDSPEEIHILLNELRSDYLITASTTADDAFPQLLEQDHPSIILMDVNMPGTNGYEACRRIKSDPNLEDIEVIFLSSNDNTDEIIKGLDVGALDYLVKPYDPDVLRTKINKALKFKEKKHQLSLEASTSNQVAYTIIAESSNLGQVINYYRLIFDLNAPGELAKALTKVLKKSGLNAVVFFRTENIQEAYSTAGDTSMLELELLDRLRQHDEVFLENGPRVFAIEKEVTILIKNAPEDPVKRGSMKDFIRMLMDATRAQLDVLTKISSTANKNIKTISDVIIEAKSALDELHLAQENHKKKGVTILDKMLANVEGSFFSMGLTDQQEEKIMSILTSSVNDALDHVESGLEMDDHLKEIVIKLSRAAKQAVS